MDILNYQAEQHKAIKKWMEKAGVSHSELARVSGKPQPWVTRYLNSPMDTGEDYRNITLKTLGQLHAAIKVIADRRRNEAMRHDDEAFEDSGLETAV